MKIDQQANLVLFEARGINFIKTRNELERLQGMVDDTETTIKDVRAGLLDLRKLMKSIARQSTILRRSMKDCVSVCLLKTLSLDQLTLL